MVMRIGITVSHFDGFRPSKLLGIAQKMGVEFVEFNRSLLEDIEEVSRSIGRMESGYHLPLVEEDGFDFSCLNHKQEIEDVIRLLNQHGRKLNLRYALTHPPQPDLASQYMESSIEFWVDNLKRLDFPILLENVVNWGEKDFHRLMELLKEKLGEQFWGICFDGPHSFLRGEDVFSRYRELAPYVKCFHLSDCSLSEDLHMPFGMGGVFPIREFLRFIKAMNADAIINLEINPGSLDNLKHLIESYLLVMKIMQPARYVATKASLLWKIPALKREISKVLESRETPAAV